MNPEVKALWVEALRSGRYRRGVGALATRDVKGHRFRYCPLGVLEDLAVRQGVTRQWKRGLTSGVHRTTEGGLRFTPSVTTTTWAGLETGLPAMTYRGEQVPIDALNDMHNVSFKKMAALIEEQL